MRERTLSLALALLWDFALGDPESWPHPVRFMGRAYAGFERFFRRRGRLTRLQGIVTVVCIGWVSALVPFLCLRWVGPFWARVLLESFLLYLCLSVRGLSDEVTRVGKALAAGDLKAARRFLSRVVGRDTGKLTKAAVARAAVETVGESFVDGFLSPVFWGLLGGAPAAFFFKAVSTGDSMIGHPEPPYRDYGWAAARLDDVLNFIPARLCPLVLAPAALLAGLSPSGLIKSFFRDRLRHASPNAAHGEAAFAGALGVRLGGLNYYGGKSYRQVFLNRPGRSCQPKDIRAAVNLLWWAAAVTALGLSVGGFWP